MERSLRVAAQHPTRRPLPPVKYRFHGPKKQFTVRDEILRKRIAKLQAIKSSRLTIGERNELKQLLLVQTRIEKGSLRLREVKRYRGQDEYDQVKRLERKKSEDEVRRYLETFRGHAADAGSPGEAAQQTGLGVELPQPGISVSQRSKNWDGRWRIGSLRYQLTVRIVSAKDWLSQLFRKSGSALRGSHRGRNEHIRCPPEFFIRRDKLFFHIANGTLCFRQPPPRMYHDVFDAATRVIRVEDSIGYRFNDKMICVQAIKTTAEDYPILWQGTTVSVVDNRRLALLGDRAMGLALCELWWDTKLGRREYASMASDLESRSALAARGKQLGVGNIILKRAHTEQVSDNAISETVEAIVGAVYLDSNHSMSAVRRVIKKLGLKRDLQQLAGKFKETSGPMTSASHTSVDKPVEPAEIDSATEAPLSQTTSSGMRATEDPKKYATTAQEPAQQRELVDTHLSEPIEATRVYGEPSHAEMPPDSHATNVTATEPSIRVLADEARPTEVSSSENSPNVPANELTENVSAIELSGKASITEPLTIAPATEFSTKTSNKARKELPAIKPLTEALAYQPSTATSTTESATGVPTIAPNSGEYDVKQSALMAAHEADKVGLMMKRVGVECQLAGDLPQANLAECIRKLEYIEDRMRHIGITKAEYETYKSSRLADNKSVQNQYGRLREKEYNLEVELWFPELNPGRRQENEKQLRDIRRRMELIHSAPSDAHTVAVKDAAAALKATMNREGLSLLEILGLRILAAKSSRTIENTLSAIRKKYIKVQRKKTLLELGLKEDLPAEERIIQTKLLKNCKQWLRLNEKKYPILRKLHPSSPLSGDTAPPDRPLEQAWENATERKLELEEYSEDMEEAKDLQTKESRAPKTEMEHYPKDQIEQKSKEGHFRGKQTEKVEQSQEQQSAAQAEVEGTKLCLDPNLASSSYQLSHHLPLHQYPPRVKEKGPEIDKTQEENAEKHETKVGRPTTKTPMPSHNSDVQPDFTTESSQHQSKIQSSFKIAKRRLSPAAPELNILKEYGGQNRRFKRTSFNLNQHTSVTPLPTKRTRLSTEKLTAKECIPRKLAGGKAIAKDRDLEKSRSEQSEKDSSKEQLKDSFKEQSKKDSSKEQSKKYSSEEQSKKYSSEEQSKKDSSKEQSKNASSKESSKK